MENEFEQAVAAVKTVLLAQVDRTLSDLEVELLKGAWDNLTYEEIAKNSGYSLNYLQRDVGPKFWKLLSDGFGRKCNKTNARAILMQRARESSLQPTQQPSFSQSLPAPPVPRASFPTLSRIDWGEAIDVSLFYGREEELKTLSRWIVQERCLFVALLGMGGVGKSSLAAKIAADVQSQFDCIIWRSLRNAPSLDTLLADLVTFLSNHQDVQARPERLLYWLRQSRCLVVLDNAEMIMQAGDRAGSYQPGYEGYGELFRLLGESTHQSCILFTSREKLLELSMMEEQGGRMRSLCLTGSWEASQALLNANRLIGSPEDKQKLCEHYGNNPLALKIVAASVRGLFDSDIALFLEQDTLILSSLRRLLDQQFERLSPLEKTVMYWLAINREWTSVTELLEDIVPRISRLGLLEVLESLSWRSLIEKLAGYYTQQPVVMEYVIERLITQVLEELDTGSPFLLLRHALVKTNVKDYVRESQEQLILRAIAQRWRNQLRPQMSLEQEISRVLTVLHQAESPSANYGLGNFINLCRSLDVDLSGFDFSNHVIREI
ncbi:MULTISPECIES: NB-ARC domain-containing protein [unclassified Leptolyngbya]|uniref:NB-ARC domain-containing protein n=1 Tax=unclassified Leptolyngbya TaxID=2650499 RepID=UPI0016882B2B|nr:MULTISPECIES: NB-ARC domain-containing protein [unclassified Leptolyngbya]MBD1913413.1 hypothetical protein [Leptolyngbya sp. FACHB-8]MBD2155808.1 hypothetical protein [Leptolyngbya sp. FACHB-16]